LKFLYLTRLRPQAAHLIELYPRPTSLRRIVKVKVNADHAARVFGTLFDKRQLIRREPTAITDVDAKINDLAAKLETIGSAAQRAE